jgi:hypothetical protein
VSFQALPDWHWSVLTINTAGTGGGPHRGFGLPVTWAPREIVPAAVAISRCHAE